MEAKMSLQARRELIFRIRDRYQHANKAGKTEISNDFIHATGYGRKHAITVLSDATTCPEPLKLPVSAFNAENKQQQEKLIHTIANLTLHTTQAFLYPAITLSKRGCGSQFWTPHCPE